VKPEYMRYKIEHPTLEGLVHLGEVMKQFILWHKKDIVLNIASPTPSDVHLERVVEDKEVYSPACDDHRPQTPHSSPTTDKPHTSPPRHTEQGHDEVPHSSPTPSKLLTDKAHTSPPHHTEQAQDEVPHSSPTPSELVAGKPHTSPPRHTEQVAPNKPHTSPPRPTTSTEQVAPNMPEPPQQARPIPKRGLPNEKMMWAWLNGKSKRRFPTIQGQFMLVCQTSR
jgi:hypothetical protein